MNDVGSIVLSLPPHQVLRRFRLPGAELYLVVLDGWLEVVDEHGTASSYAAGELVVCPAGRARTLATGPGSVRLVAVALPAGPEVALPSLVRGRHTWGEELQRVADVGVEVLLDDQPTGWPRVTR